MSETKMPAVEAGGANERELASYELAFHVLPTIAEGEVPAVFQKVKDLIISHGGVITTEEAPARFDLAYEIVKYLEGRNRKFSSAYFGWVRFEIEAAELDKLTGEVGLVKELLRHLLIKLNKVEEANPFFFHQALAELKVRNVTIDDVVKATEEVEVDPVEEGEGSSEETKEDGEVTEVKV